MTTNLTKLAETLSPNKRQLLELLLKEKEKARKAEAVPVKATPAKIPRREKFSPGPVSSAQQRLWFIDQLDPGTPAFNIPAAVRLLGSLNVEILEKCFDEIIKRHESLRTSFAADDGLPVQVIAPALKFDIPLTDICHLPEAERMAHVEKLITSECQRSFDLTRSPLLRATLVVLGEHDHVLVMMMHHIIGDVWSVRVVMKELAALYEAFSAGRPSPLPELPIQYCDYSTWQREWLQGEALQSQLAYWKQKLTGMSEALELPTDRPRPAVQSIWGAKHFLKIPKQLTDTLRALAQEEKASLFMTLLAAWKVLLHRYTEQHDIVVGAPVANRNRSEFEGMVGFFVNSLILRTDLSGDPTFRELLRRVRETTFEAFANQDFPFERLVEVVQPTRSMSRNPLFQTDFILQNSPRSSYQVTGLTFEALPVENGTAQLDLTLDLWEEPDGIGGWLEYDTDLFDASSAARMVGNYINLLERIAAEPGQPIAGYSLLSDADRRRILVEWNATARSYELDSAFPRLFEEQVARTPNAIAVVCGATQLNYAELNQRANSLAHLLTEQGVGADAVVGLLMRRDINLLISILAVLKAGGAYLPLDPDYPVERHRTIVGQSGACVVITAREFLPIVEELDATLECGGLPPLCYGAGELEAKAAASRRTPRRCVVVEEALAQERETENLGPRSLPDNLAYIIYTSGSTGVPKGVMIHQRGMINHLWANIEALSMTNTDVLAQTASQCFDISVWQFLAPLIIGGRVHIFPDEITQDPPRLLREIDRTGVTVFEMVPSLLQVALAELKTQEQKPELGRLRWLLPTGEEVPAALCREWFRSYPRVPLMNAYGPSECSDDVTLAALYESPEESVSRVTIGKPVGNLQVAIVDRELSLVPVGVPGELCVRGVGVGRGYLGLPARTASVFVPDPFSAEAGARMYRSGDRARYLADGSLEFLGRMDHQVKVRGHRIELGEIEAVLSQVAGVAEAVVIVREDTPGDARLVGYVVWEAGVETNSAEVREQLRRRLPDYMVPAALLTLERMPLSPNGKVDRKSLPAPEATSSNEQNFIGPRNPTEEVLSAIWSEILNTERIGVEDNLFEHGAHSLLVTQVTSRIRKLFKVEPPLRLFFECPTIGGMARAIDTLQGQAEGIAAPPIVRIKREGDLPLSFTQERMWFLDQLEPGLTAYNVPGAVFLDGRLDVKALEEAFGEILRRHEILRTTYGSTGGRPFQIINAPQSFHLHVEDLQHLPEHERDAAALQLAKDNAQRPFNLSTGPMVRCFLVRMGPEKHLLAMTTHHIAYDMWSREIFIFELAVLYQAFIKGESSPLPEPEIQWVDYAHWQRQWLDGEVLEKQLDYWRRKLEGAPPHLDLPIDLPRPAVQSYRGARQYLQLPPELARNVRVLSKKHGVTPYITLLAAFKTLLWRYTGQDQIVVGSPIANRNRLESEKLMGFLANTITLYTDVSGNPTFTELLERVRETSLDAYAHQDVPFELLVQALQTQRDMSRSPLFQVMFNYMMNYSAPQVDLPDLTLRLERLHSGAAQFEINVDMWETEDGLNGVVEYCTELFHHATITRFITQFRILLEAITAEPGQSIASYSLLSEADRQRVLVEWNATARAYELDSAFPRLFETQVARTPEAIAVVCGATQLNYAELNQRANGLAHLLTEQGVGADAVVGLLMRRDINLLISILAVLKAGGAYLPLDPDYPVERHRTIVGQSGACVVITAREFLPIVEELGATLECGGLPPLCDGAGDFEAKAAASRRTPRRGLVVEEALAQERETENLGPRSLPDNLAYIIYTSGSTGVPKGVMIHQRGMINHLWANIEALSMTNADVLAQTASQCFDISVWQFLAPLIIGGRVHIFPDEITQDPPRLLREIDGTGVTVFEMVPSLLQVALAELKTQEQKPELGRLRWLLPTGEEVPAALCREWFRSYPRVPLMNAYGPSECSDDVTLAALYESPDESVSRVTIGKPVGNLQVAIVDRELNLVPVGVPGELCVRGVGVGRGYLGLPARTASVFVPDPFSVAPGARMYRSGDRARYLADGSLEFLGRMDHQVKVRGHRIELGEIEAVLSQVAGVAEAVVIVREDTPGDARLVGYVVWEAGVETNSAEVREQLRRRLPDYMVPAALLTLERMPLSPNGKVDRKALPVPDISSQVRESTAYVEPQTELEKTIVQCWNELLNVEQIGLNDDFFDLGGHSLLATQFLSRLRDRTGVEVSLKAFFETSTVAGVAKSVTAIRWVADSLRFDEQNDEAGMVLEEGVL